MFSGYGIQMYKLAVALLWLVALIVCALVYGPGLHGPFVFDDGINVVNNPALRLTDMSIESLHSAAFSVSSGLLGRPISMLSFAFNFYLDRDNIQPFLSAYPFKLTNLAIHCLNGLLVFVLTRALVGLYRRLRQPDLPAAYPAWLALAVSAAWLLHPLNLTSVLYVVQRMASVSAFFSFLGLTVYLWGRTRLFAGQRGGMPAILGSLLICGPLAVLSKENGALLPLFMLAAELILFRFQTAQTSAKRFLLGFFAALVILPILCLLAYLVLHPELVLAPYAKRDFSLGERLMTEARVVWFYLRLIVLPDTALMGIFHDDIPLSTHLLAPLTTLPAVLGMLALPLLAWWLRRSQPLVAFGLVFFLIGHSMESTVYPLELVHEHRNYLPMFGILLAFFDLLLTPLLAVSTLRARQLLACLLIPLFALGTWSRANTWSSAGGLWAAEAEHHLNSIRANVALADYFSNTLSLDPAVQESNYQLAREYYKKTIALGHDNAPALLGLIQLTSQHNDPVETVWLNKLRDSLMHEVLPANINDHLLNLAMCLKREHCPLTAETIEPLLRAPLLNPKLTSRDRALIYNTLTIYQFEVRGDNAGALKSAQLAISLDSDINHRFWLASILVAMHRGEEARQQIGLLKQRDVNGLRSKEIADLEQQLTQNP